MPPGAGNDGLEPFGNPAEIQLTLFNEFDHLLLRFVHVLLLEFWMFVLPMLKFVRRASFSLISNIPLTRRRKTQRLGD